MTVAPFELAIQVQPSDIDQLGHVNNVVYLRWVQDVAAAHWRAAATDAERRGVLWVVVRHEIDYKHPARLADGIVARTWVGEATRSTFERHTEILRVRDRRLLVRARTLWCPIDPATFRPKHVADDVRERFSVAAAEERASHPNPRSS